LLPKKKAKMAETKEKIKLEIEHGPVTPMQKEAWAKFWRKLLAAPKLDREVSNGK
jgi:hypothetical protein